MLVYTVKIVKFPVRIISEHLKKAISLMFETETVGPCLVRKLKWEGHGPLALVVATPLIYTNLQRPKENLNDHLLHTLMESIYEKDSLL